MKRVALKKTKKRTVAKTATKKAAVKKPTKKTAAGASKRITAAAKKSKRPKISGKIGIFGGYFNPIHVGHMQSMMEVQQKMGLKKILVIPANVPPHKIQSGPEAQDRVEMVRTAIASYSEVLELDTREVERGGVSYTVDTLRELNEAYDPEQLYLILGADAFLGLDSWRNPEEILERTSIIMTSRFGTEAEFSPEILPSVVRQHLNTFVRGKANLTTGRTVEHVEIEPVDASATDIRKRIRDGKDVEGLLQPAVQEFIREKGLYKRKSPLVDDYHEFTKFCAERLVDKKAKDVKAYDLTNLKTFTEYTVIASGTSTRHASALAENLVVAVKECFGLHPLSVEGAREGRWILVDYGALVVHVFYDVVRAEYRLEDLWKAGSEIKLEHSQQQARTFEQLNT